MNREGHHPVEKQKFRQLAKKHKLDLVLLFGSYVREGGPPPNDIDIAVRSNRILSEREKIEITYELCSIFQTNHIDLVDIKTAPPVLKREIFKEFKILYERDPMLLYQLELVSLYEFNEAKILHALRRERLEEFIK